MIVIEGSPNVELLDCNPNAVTNKGTSDSMKQVWLLDILVLTKLNFIKVNAWLTLPILYVMFEFSIAVMRMIVSRSSEFGGTKYVLSTLAIGGSCSIRWSHAPEPPRLTQSLPDNAAIGTDDSINVPVKSVICSIWYVSKRF